ncbi:MAG: beta-N-acetylhexosaminidase [Caulobacteraceae bacterium]
MLVLAASPAAAVTVDVIPMPASVDAGTGAPVWVRPGARIQIPPGDSGARNAASWLVSLSARSRGLALTMGGRRPPAIVFKRVAGPREAEAYTLDIGHGRMVIAASSDAGLLYGAVTLWQLMTAEQGRGSVRLASVHIADRPRFAWRGLLLDSARHMQSPAFILKTIDWMALHKLNVLQWHLTDDQGWRLPVTGYPRLTSIGAWRVQPSLGPPSRGWQQLDPKTGKPRLYGGFYTRSEIRAIVAHGRARNVTIVPEIEMPGHALSALLAYPELSAGPVPPRSMQSDWGLIPDAFGVDEPVFAFLDQVLTQVTTLFPSRFIDIGGDEVPLDLWKASPAVQARMKALGLADEAAVQNYFIRRIDGFLGARGRRLIGWEEILRGGTLPADAAISSWQGAASAVTAARAGHDVVLAIAPTLYFDNRQSGLASEPPGRGWVVSLRDVYALDPAAPPLPPVPPTVPGAAPPPPLTMTEADRAHILGVQGNLWTEHVSTDERAMKMMWPRAAAVAEAGWTPQAARAWPDFLARMPAEFARFAAIGLDEDESAFALDSQAVADRPGRARVVLSNQTNQGQVRFTLDGTPPGATARVYGGPIETALPARLRAAAFEGGQRISPELDERLDAASLRTRVSQQLTLCPGTLPLNLEGQPTADGRRPVFLIQIMNPCWTWPAADLSGVSRARLTLAATPNNLQLGPQTAQVVHRPTASPNGEFQVRLDNCDTGRLLAIVPLPAPAAEVTLEADLPATAGTHGLCFIYAGGARVDPIWGLEKVELIEGPGHG